MEGSNLINVINVDVNESTKLINRDVIIYVTNINGEHNGKRPFLYQKINDCVSHAINEADANVNEAQILFEKNKKRNRFILVFLIGAILTGLIFLSVFIKNLIYRPYNDVLRDDIKKLEIARSTFHNDVELYNNYTNFIASNVKLYYDKAVNIDNSGNYDLCVAGINYGILDMCLFYIDNYRENSLFFLDVPCVYSLFWQDYQPCSAIVQFFKGGTKLYLENNIKYLQQERYKLQGQIEMLENQISHLMYEIKNGFPGERFQPDYLGVFIRICGVLICIIIFSGCLVCYKSKKMNNELIQASCINNCINNPRVANEIINISDRLSISIYPELATIDNFLNDVHKKEQAMALMWKSRIAFLGGYLRPESTTYVFLSHSFSKDVKRMILQMSDLVV